MLNSAPTPQNSVGNIIASYKANNADAPSVASPVNSNSWYSQMKQGTFSTPTSETDTTEAATPTPETGGFAEVGNDIKSDAGNYASEINTENSSTDNPIVKGISDVGSGAKLIGNAATDLIKPAIKPEIKQDIKGAISDVAQTPEAQALGKAWNDFETAHPEVAKVVKATGNIASILPGPEGGEVAGQAIREGTEAGTKVASEAIPAVASAAKEGASNVAEGVKNAVKTGVKTVTESEPATNIKTAIAKTNVSEQAQNSAKRLADQAPLIGGGAARLQKPLDMYNQFAKQEAKHLADIKEDPAISKVGEEIGDAFGTVVKQRQTAGKTMASELEKTAANPVNTNGAFSNFQKELLDNGASYDSVKKELTAGNESKFGESDKAVLEKYAGNLQNLGSKPTMKALDAFISKTPQDIKALKATRGITFKTNAERLINNNLNDLRDALGKAGTPEYNTARAQYSNLSKFVNEGASHLGKITQSGDFAKDASLAKSSVQSVLNNGKKDWLMKLEDLTGYPALDKSTLALQAMKDAGDAKGNSLLELMTEGGKSVPITPSGLMSRFGSWAYGKGKEKLAGNAADQTRAFLKSLEQEGK